MLLRRGARVGHFLEPTRLCSPSHAGTKPNTLALHAVAVLLALCLLADVLVRRPGGRYTGDAPFEPKIRGTPATPLLIPAADHKSFSLVLEEERSRLGGAMGSQQERQYPWSDPGGG